MKKNVLLLGVLLALAAIFAYTQLTKDKNERSFSSELVNFDKDEITYLLIDAPENDKLEFNKNGDTWEIMSEGNALPVKQGIVEQLLVEFSAIKSKRIAALKKDKWADFKVDDAGATQVMLKAGNQEKAHLYIGKFSMQQMSGNPQMPNMGQQQQPQFTTYIRINGQEVTHAIDGMLQAQMGLKAASLVDTSSIQSPINLEKVAPKSE